MNAVNKVLLGSSILLGIGGAALKYTSAKFEQANVDLDTLEARLETIGYNSKKLDIIAEKILNDFIKKNSLYDEFGVLYRPEIKVVENIDLDLDEHILESMAKGSSHFRKAYSLPDTVISLTKSPSSENTYFIYGY